MNVTIVSSNRGLPVWAGQKTTYSIGIENATTDSPLVHAELRLKRIANTGGHHHGGETIDRAAVGAFAPSKITLKGLERVNVEYTAPEVCGDILWENYSVEAASSRFATIQVRIEGLVLIELEPSAEYDLKLPTATHPSSYWVKPHIKDKLTTLGRQFRAETRRKFTVTEASLQYGGLFDYNPQAEWRPPHYEHKYGDNVDVRSGDMHEAERDAFLRLARAAGFSILVEANHFHLRG